VQRRAVLSSYLSPVKFVHAADLHIDSPIRNLPGYDGAPVDAAIGATRRALQGLVTLCVEERASFLLLSGDIVDAHHRDHKTGLFFVREMLKLRDAGIVVFFVRGNHDAASRIMQCLLLPDNVIELGLSQPETVVTEGLGVAVHGQSYLERSTTDNLAAGYPRPIAGALNIGLLHTSADGREGHDTYAPCTLATLKRLGYEYWALGHVHTREILCQAPLVVFPGNLQGRNARERGPKGATLVTAQGARIIGLESRALDVLRFCICEVDVADAPSFDAILHATAMQLRRLVEEDDSDDRVFAVRVVLEGVPGVGALLSHAPSRCLDQIRRVATRVGEGRIWIEEVHARSGMPLFCQWTVGSVHGSLQW